MKICLSIISRTFWIVWMEPEANFSWIHGSSNWAENMSEAPFGRERLKMNVLAEPPITLTIGRYINIQHQKSSFSNYLNYKLTPHISIFTEWLVQLTKEPCQPFVFYFCQQELAGGNEYGLGEFSGGLIFLSQLWCKSNTQPPLPPLHITCSWTLAVSTISPSCLKRTTQRRLKDNPRIKFQFHNFDQIWLFKCISRNHKCYRAGP